MEGRGGCEHVIDTAWRWQAHAAAAHRRAGRATPSARPGTTRKPEGSPGPGLPRMCKAAARALAARSRRSPPAALPVEVSLAVALAASSARSASATAVRFPEAFAAATTASAASTLRSLTPPCWPVRWKREGAVMERRGSKRNDAQGERERERERRVVSACAWIRVLVRLRAARARGRGRARVSERAQPQLTALGHGHALAILGRGAGHAVLAGRRAGRT